MKVLVVDCYGHSSSSSTTNDVGQRCMGVIQTYIQQIFGSGGANVQLEIKSPQTLDDILCDWEAGMIISDTTKQNAIRYDKYCAVFIVGMAGNQTIYTPWHSTYYPVTRLIHMCNCVHKPLLGIGLGALLTLYTLSLDAMKVVVLNPPFGSTLSCLPHFPPPTSTTKIDQINGVFQQLWLESTTGDMYKFDRKGGQWLPHCNTGLHVVNFTQNQEVDQAAAAAAAAAGTSTTSTHPSLHLPTPPKSPPPPRFGHPLPSHHSPPVLSSPRRVQHRILNGHTVTQRDTSSIHPTPSRIRPEYRQHWAVQGFPYATFYLTPLKQWRVNCYGKLPTGGGGSSGGGKVGSIGSNGSSNTGGVLGSSNNSGGGGSTMKDKNSEKRKPKPVSPFITVVDGPFGPIVLTKATNNNNNNNNNRSKVTSSSGSGSNNHNHHPSLVSSYHHPPQDIMLLLFNDMERDSNTDIVRSFFTHFACEIQRREEHQLRPLSQADYNRHYTMSGFLFGAIQGKSKKEDNWRGSEYVENKMPVGAVATAAVVGDSPVVIR